MSCTAERLKGWQNYPVNIGYSEQHNQICDYARYRDELNSDAPRLFDDSEIYMKVIEIGRRDILFEDLSSLEAYLQEPPVSGSIRVFLIPQAFSWGQLNITFDGIRKLCTSLQVYAPFLDVLRAFGQKTEASNDSFSAFNVQKHPDTSTFEMSYIIKHAEKHERDRADPNDQWSFRQMGVYQRLESDSTASIIVLNPSQPFFRRLRDMSSAAKIKSSWNCQEVLLSCATYQWKWCLSDFEQRLSEKKRKAHLSKVSELGRKASAVSMNDLEFEDVQDIQVLQDKSLQIRHFLEIDCELLRLIEENASGPSDTSEALQTLTREMSEQTRRAQIIVQRVEGVLGLTKSLLDFQCLETSNRCLEKLTINADLMHQMTLAAQDENQHLLELSRKAAWDTDILKTITFLTLIYLPASFCTSMMSMGYIKVSRVPGLPLISFEKEFYVFLVASLVLCVVTLGVYFWWFKTQQVRRNKQARWQR